MPGKAMDVLGGSLRTRPLAWALALFAALLAFYLAFTPPFMVLMQEELGFEPCA